MSGPALYVITEKFKELEALAEMEDLPPEIVADTLEGIEAEWDEKAVAVAAFIQNLEHTADGIQVAADSMHARGARLHKRAEALKAYLQFHMTAMGKQKLDNELFVIKLAKNPPAVVIDDEKQIPEKYWTQPPAPPKRLDKAAIGADIKAGKEVPGAHTFQGERLEIKA